MIKLYIYPKKGESFCFSVMGEKTKIGRLPDNDIPIHDPFCSGHHAVIDFKEDEYFLRDRGSKNGTFLNGQKIKVETGLKKGDEILLGSTRIFFDKELSTDVEVTDLPANAVNINTIMRLDEVFQKSDAVSEIDKKGDSVDIEKLQAENKSFSIINDMSRALVAHKSLSDLLEHIMELICESLPMDRGILMLNEGNPVQLIPRVVKIKEDHLKKQKILVSQSIINMVVDKHSSILISDVLSDPNFKSQESIIQLNIHSAMCVPLWNNKDIIGIIYSDRITIDEKFNKEDLRLLTLLSNLAAVKVENSKLMDEALEMEKMEKEISLAAHIQKDFLPKKNPEWENYEIAGSNIPCHQVGGDYYDFFLVDKSRRGFVIADVSGKGMSASLLMASLRAAIYSEINPHYNIKEMVVKLNDFIHKSSAINHFITFFYCEINRKTGNLNYVNAGHNYPIIIDSKGKIRRLESTGLCLGMFSELPYETKNTTLKKGDISILFTDGITESRNKSNKEFTEEKLVSLCQKNRNKSAEEILDIIFKEVESFTSGTAQMDDMTIIVIKRVA